MLTLKACLCLCTQDLANVRIAAAFLSKTELNFDLVSAVDELAAQIKLEFDFEREAKVMDAIAEHLKVFTPDFRSQASEAQASERYLEGSL